MVFRRISKYFEIFGNISKFFEIFRNISKYLKIFRNILTYGPHACTHEKLKSTFSRVAIEKYNEEPLGLNSVSSHDASCQVAFFDMAVRN